MKPSGGRKLGSLFISSSPTWIQSKALRISSVRLSAEDRAQVWGATIPLEQSQNAHALFDVEFDHLYDALMRRRLVRLGVPAPPAEQLRVFNFPLSFGESRRKLGLFTSALFRPNPFSENPLLRGFYFTSSATGGRSKARPQSVAAKSGVTTATLVKPAAVGSRGRRGESSRSGLLYRETIQRCSAQR